VKIYAAPAPVPGALSPEVARVERIARHYRRLVLLVGSQILAVFGLTALMTAVAPGASIAGGAIELASVGIRIALFLAGMVVGYQLADALGEGNPWLWAIGMLFPVINLVVLAALSSKANAWCQKAGVKVGLLGPTAASLQELRQRQN
jgi:hypothetical protein